MDVFFLFFFACNKTQEKVKDQTCEVIVQARTCLQTNRLNYARATERNNNR